MGYLMIVAFMGGYPFYRPQPIQPRPVKPPMFATRVQPKITLKPGQACAIPLLNVLPKKTNDNMVKRIPPAPFHSEEIVTPPAPSCDDVK